MERGDEADGSKKTNGAECKWKEETKQTEEEVEGLHKGWLKRETRQRGEEGEKSDKET